MVDTKLTVEGMEQDTNRTQIFDRKINTEENTGGNGRRKTTWEPWRSQKHQLDLFTETETDVLKLKESCITKRSPCPLRWQLKPGDFQLYY
jgi:hypothetical protein